MKKFKEYLSFSLKDKIGEIKLENVTIEFDGFNYILSAESTERKRLSILSKELNDNPTCFSDYIVNPSELKGENCKYDLSDTIMLRLYVETIKYSAKYHWIISSFKKIIQTDGKDDFVCYAVPIDKKTIITELEHSTFEVEYKHNTYFLSQNEDKDILIRTNKDNKDISIVLALLSLYQGTAMEILCKEECKRGKKTISFLPIQYRFRELNSFANDFDYIKHQSLADFVLYMKSSINTVENYTSKTKGEYMVKAIERYTISKYVDNLTKFVYLVSILETISEKVESIKKTEQVEGNNGGKRYNKRMAYEIVSESLTKKNIDLSKLNDVVKEDLDMDNFVNLRNEILHRLPSEKIVNFLNYKYPMFYLEFTVFIEILHHLGFDNIQFREGFVLSIYKE